MDVDVGGKLRALRQLHGLSQRELAKRAGVTNGMISLIEQNRVSPSVSSLKKVLDGIPMALAEFFALDLTATPAVFYPRSEQVTVSALPFERQLLAASRTPRAMSLTRDRLAPGAASGSELRVADGEAGGFVVRGRVELVVAGATRVLEPGDGYYFARALPHRFRNPGREDCEIIGAVSTARL